MHGHLFKFQETTVLPQCVLSYISLCNVTHFFHRRRLSLV